MNAVKIYEEAVRAAEHNEITLGEFEKRIEPLKDVEAVVRCKYCKHYDENRGTCVKNHVHGNAETWFCADGKRR